MLKSKKSKFDFTNNPILMLRTFRHCCKISISVCPFPLAVHLFLDKSDGGTGECQHWCPLLLLFSPVRITGSSLRTTEQMSVLSITVESHTSLLRGFLNGSSLFAPDIPHRLWSSVRVQGEKSICLAGWRGFSQNPQSDPRSDPQSDPRSDPRSEPQLCLRRCCFVTSEVLTVKQSSSLTLTATALSVYSFDGKMTFF